VLETLGQYSPHEVDKLISSGATVEALPENGAATRPDADGEVRILRGELSRVDAKHDDWRAQAASWGQE
jgi:hypothetical protein